MNRLLQLNYAKNLISKLLFVIKIEMLMEKNTPIYFILTISQILKKF